MSIFQKLKFSLKFLRIIVDYEWNFMCWPREVIFTLGKDYEGVKAKLSIARQPLYDTVAEQTVGRRDIVPTGEGSIPVEFLAK